MILNSVTVQNGRFLVPKEHSDWYKWADNKILLKKYVWRDWILTIKDREIFVEGPCSIKYPLIDGVLYLCSCNDTSDNFHLRFIDLERSYIGKFNQETCYSIDKSFGDYKRARIRKLQNSTSQKSILQYAHLIEYLKRKDISYQKLKPLYFYTIFININFIRLCKKYNIEEIIKEDPNKSYRVDDTSTLISDGIISDEIINNMSYKTVKNSLFTLECKKDTSGKFYSKQGVPRLDRIKTILHTEDNLLTLEYLIDTALEVCNDI